MNQQRTKVEERRIREAALDKTIADSFPASDPPSSLPNPSSDRLGADLTAAATDRGDTPATGNPRERS